MRRQRLQENYLTAFAQVTLNLWAINDEQKCKKPTRNLSQEFLFFPQVLGFTFQNLRSELLRGLPYYENFNMRMMETALVYL